MAKRDPVEMAKFAARKRIRNQARLEASIRADYILNEIEDEFAREFDRRVAAGEPYQVTSFQTWVNEAVDQKFPALPVA